MRIELQGAVDISGDMTFVFTCQIFNKRSIDYWNAHKLHLLKRRSPEKIIVKLFVRFRPLCLRYLQRATHLDANERIWRCF